MIDMKIKALRRLREMKENHEELIDAIEALNDYVETLQSKCDDVGQQLDSLEDQFSTYVENRR